MFAQCGYCNFNKPKLYKVISKENKVLFLYVFKSYSFTGFTWLFDLFYPSHLLEGRGPLSDGKQSRINPSVIEGLSPASVAVSKFGFPTNSAGPMASLTRQNNGDVSTAQRVKIIPRLDEYLSPLVLATLFLSTVYEGNAIYKAQARFNTSYYASEVEDLKYLSRLLKNKYNIETNIYNSSDRPFPSMSIPMEEGVSYRTLYIKNSSVFSSVVKPYILPSQVHLLNRPNLKLNLFGINFKRYLTLSSSSYLSAPFKVKVPAGKSTNKDFIE